MLSDVAFFTPKLPTITHLSLVEVANRLAYLCCYWNARYKYNKWGGNLNSGKNSQDFVLQALAILDKKIEWTGVLRTYADSLQTTGST